MTQAFDLRRRPLSRACLAALGLAAALAQTSVSAQVDGGAADPGSRKGFGVVPRIGVSETWTDNLALSPDNSRDRAFITTISPGISLTANTGWVRGSFDYTLDGIVYTKSDRKNRLQNQMNGRATAELVETALYVDVVGSISQQTVSAFGTQSPDSTLDNSNRTETRNLQVSPYWRGRLGNAATFELRATGQIRDSSEGGSSSLGGGGGDSKEGTLQLSMSGPAGRSLNWGLNAATTRSHFEQTGLDYRTTNVVGSLNWVADVDWMLGATFGRERSDYLGPTTTGIYGVTLRWTPTPRTKLNADWQHHSYGNSHNLSFEHRMSQFSVRATSSQAVNTGQTPTQGTNYQLLDLQFQTQEPDPVKRDALVRMMLNLLGLNPNGLSGSGFLSNSAMLQRRTDLSLIWAGQRLTVTVSGNDNNSRRLNTAPVGSGDLALTDRVRQRGATVSAGYRLTPVSNANLSYTRQNSRGDGVGGNDMRSLTANVSYRLGPRTDTNVGVRMTKFDDTSLFANSYQEHAIFASLNQRF